MSLLEKLGSLYRGFEFLQVVVVLAFLAAFPPLCLVNGMYGGALITSALGLFGLWWAFDAVTLWVGEKKRKALKGLLLVMHCVIITISLVQLIRPPGDQWVQVEGSGEWNNTRVARNQTTIWAHSGGPKIWKVDPKTAKATSFGQQVERFASAFDASSTHVWTAPTTGVTLAGYDIKTGQPSWIKRPAGSLRAFVAGEDMLWMTIDRGLWSFDLSRRQWRPHLESARVHEVCHHKNQVVAIGRRQWHESLDGGKTWRDITPKTGVPSHWYQCAVRQSVWVYEGGMFEGLLWVREQGQWHQRPLPVRDIRVLEVDPTQTQRAILGSWGKGIWETTDGGKTWRDLGLHGFEVRRLSFLPGTNTLVVASSNTVFRRGLWLYRPWSGKR